MRLVGLWRHPVKSLAGERVIAAAVDARGIERDRLWALVDSKGGIASGKTTRRFRAVRGLRHHRSQLDHGQPLITLTDGRSARADTPELGALVAAIAPPGWSLQRENRTPYVDAGAVHIVTTAALATLSRLARDDLPVQRLRPNLVLDVGHAAPFPEDAWLGHTLEIATVKLRITERTERCVIVGHAQTALDAQPMLLETIGRANNACAGVSAEVLVPGTLTEGDIRDGQIVEHWAQRDDYGMAHQLGWVPPTPGYLVRSALAKRRARRAADPPRSAQERPFAAWGGELTTVKTAALRAIEASPLGDGLRELDRVVHHVVAEGNLVAVHAAITGEHAAAVAVRDADSRIGRVHPPTGRRFSVQETHWVRVDGEGRAVEHQTDRDDLGMAQQLGWAQPSPRYLVRMAIAKRQAQD